MHSTKHKAKIHLLTVTLQLELNKILTEIVNHRNGLFASGLILRNENKTHCTITYFLKKPSKMEEGVNFTETVNSTSNCTQLRIQSQAVQIYMFIFIALCMIFGIIGHILLFVIYSKSGFLQTRYNMYHMNLAALDFTACIVLLPLQIMHTALPTCVSRLICSLLSLLFRF